MPEAYQLSVFRNHSYIDKCFRFRSFQSSIAIHLWKAITSAKFLFDFLPPLQNQNVARGRIIKRIKENQRFCRSKYGKRLTQYIGSLLHRSAKLFYLNLLQRANGQGTHLYFLFWKVTSFHGIFALNNSANLGV